MSRATASICSALRKRAHGEDLAHAQDAAALFIFPADEPSVLLAVQECHTDNEHGGDDAPVTCLGAHHSRIGSQSSARAAIRGDETFPCIACGAGRRRRRGGRAGIGAEWVDRDGPGLRERRQEGSRAGGSRTRRAALFLRPRRLSKAHGRRRATRYQARRAADRLLRPKREARLNHHRYAEPQALLRAAGQTGLPVSDLRRPRRLHVVRHRAHQPHSRLANVDAATRDAQTAAWFADYGVGRAQQSARGTCALPRQYDLSHPRHQQ